MIKHFLLWRIWSFFENGKIRFAYQILAKYFLLIHFIPIDYHQRRGDDYHSLVMDNEINKLQNRPAENGAIPNKRDYFSHTNCTDLL